jgi:hypothetical protein
MLCDSLAGKRDTCADFAEVINGGYHVLLGPLLTKDVFHNT